MPTLEELQQAATEVVQILKGIGEYSDAKVAVIGGLALWTYRPEGRTTEDVDFIVNLQDAPHGVKQRLLSLPNTPFIQRAQLFFYNSPSAGWIQVDITAQMQSPYLPEAAKMLKDIMPQSVPYISPTDLVVFKINSCGLRAQKAKRRVDASDALELLDDMTKNGSIHLTDAQRAIVEPCIQDVVENGEESEEWWRERLGLLGDRQV